MAFKIYTKTGDKGETSLFGGQRLPKYALRIEAYGTVDELNACIGLLRDSIENVHYRECLFEIQNRLFVVGANLASDPQKAMSVPDVIEEDVFSLEREMDKMDENLAPLKNFILPGGHLAVSHCHIARTVCRRAERIIVQLAENEKVEPIIIQYINRLSDYLFVLGRAIAADFGITEVAWKPRK